MEDDKTKLTSSKDSSRGQYGSMKGLGHMPDEMLVEEDGRPPLTRRQAIIGCVLSGVLALCLCLTITSVRSLGVNQPTMEIVTLAFGIQTLSAVAGIWFQWSKFCDLSCDVVVWIVSCGLSLVLSIFCTYQANKILPPGAVGGVFLIGIIVFTLFIVSLTQCTIFKVISVISLVSIVGLGLYVHAAKMSAYDQGFTPIAGRSSMIDEVEGSQDLGAHMSASTNQIKPLPGEVYDPAITDVHTPNDDYDDDDDDDWWVFSGTEDSPKLFAYILILMAAGLFSLSSVGVYVRCYDVGLVPVALIAGIVATGLPLVELFFFSDPVTPWSNIKSGQIVAFVAFLVLFQVTCWMLYVSWLHTEPVVLVLVFSSTLVLQFAVQYATSISIPSPLPLHYTGAVFVFLASVATVVYHIKVNDAIVDDNA